MVAQVSVSPVAQYQVIIGGIPISGAKIFTYQAGTVVKQTCYTDSTGATPATNPIICDVNGIASFYMQTGLNYKIVISPSTDTDPPTNSYYTYDNLFSNVVPALPYSDAGGSSDAITGNYIVSTPILYDGYPLLLDIATPNTTTTPTFAPTLNGILQNARTIVKFVANVSTPVAVGDLQGVVSLVYNLPALVWVLQNPGIINATTLGTTSVSLASASTVNIGAAASVNITISGSVTINAFDSIIEGALKLVTFTGTPQLTYNATSMQLINGATRTIAANSVSLFRSLGGGNWKEELSSSALSGGPISATTISGTSISGGTLISTGLTDISGAAAGQIKFPATQNPSADVNTLDDYEEGTWTASVGGSATYTNQTGTYIKIGKLVYYSCLLGINLIGTGSTFLISGLPFVSSSVGQPTSGTVNFAVAASTFVYVGFKIPSTSATLNCITLAAAANTVTSNPNFFGNSTFVEFSGVYDTA